MSRNFEVLITKYNNPMLSDKGTNIFSEIGKFFKENDSVHITEMRHPKTMKHLVSFTIGCCGGS